LTIAVAIIITYFSRSDAFVILDPMSFVILVGSLMVVYSILSALNTFFLLDKIERIAFVENASFLLFGLQFIIFINFDIPEDVFIAYFIIWISIPFIIVPVQLYKSKRFKDNQKFIQGRIYSNMFVVEEENEEERNTIEFIHSNTACQMVILGDRKVGKSALSTIYTGHKSGNDSPITVKTKEIELYSKKNHGGNI